MVLMGECLSSIMKEHFALQVGSFTLYYYSMHKAMTFKRSKTTFLTSVESGVGFIMHVSFN